jgi:hypothetical protein
VESRVLGPGSARRAIHTATGSGVARAHRAAYRAIRRGLAADCESVLDVGTGLMHSLADLPCRTKIGLDAHRPYLEHREVSDAVPIHASALELERLFVPGAVALVTLIDVIEHFERAEALDLLRQAEQVAAKRVVVFTPRGPFPQAAHDPWGLGGDEFQRHRSAWDVEDLRSLEYRVVVLEGAHDNLNEAFGEAFGADAPLVDALLAWKETGLQGSRA